jgi:hypothetical protein
MHYGWSGVEGKMDEAARKNPGVMLCVLGLEKEAVAQVSKVAAAKLPISTVRDR